MSTSSLEDEPIFVKSNNGWNVDADEAFVAGSGFVRTNIHNNTNIDYDSDGDRVLVAPHVDFHILSLAAEFCRNRYNPNGPPYDHATLHARDSQFLANNAHNLHTLQELMVAGETLEIPSLLDLTRNRIQELNAQVAQVQNAAGNNLEIDQDVEIITHALRDTVLAIFAISICLILFILATGGIVYLAMQAQ